MNDKVLNQGEGITLGAFLKQARQAAGLSHRLLEAMSGVGRMTIQRLETDWFKEPSPDDLAKLARVLELNDTDLFLMAGIPVPKKNASLDVMLRAEYGLPPEAIAEAKRAVADLVAKYDTKQEGQADTR
ncbi:helix-turn-helix domain-containing protein [Actinokineospora sp. PR83]|uniref:helix-turn-helix domain-containing protein n=1 Tax=Actinokineospora sp. PR83 TaxID=2884908 RepID=UPI001F18EF5A|nr:helix-turn-helix transcriptional regulator [Actinokineospora sp. PR83]MCG8914915.1 helix-turn-helix domain-containing protein [Actinokineospora sp. PR83]